MTEFGLLFFAVIGWFIVDATVFGGDGGILFAGFGLLAVVAFYIRRGKRKAGDPTRY